MNKYKVVIFIIICWIMIYPSNVGASFYRLNDQDTSFKYGSGRDEQNNVINGWGYNIEPLKEYGYTEKDTQNFKPVVSSFSKATATIEWTTKFYQQTQIVYGQNTALDEKTDWSSWRSRNQKMTLNNLVCSKSYTYRLSIRDVAGNIYNSPLGSFLTKSCSDNALDQINYDLTSETGFIEFNLEQNVKVIRKINDQFYTIGLPSYSVTNRTILTLLESKDYLPFPTIDSGQFLLNKNVIKVKARVAGNDLNISNFNNNALLEIPYNVEKTKFDYKNLKIAWFNESQNRWVVLSTLNDVSRKVLQVSTNKTGNFAILAVLENWLPTNLQDDNIYQDLTDSKIFYYKNYTKYLITNDNILFSYGFKYTQLKKTKNLYKFFWGEDLKYRDGSIVSYNGNYYYMENGYKRILLNESIISDLGWKKEWIYKAKKDELKDYLDGLPILTADERPDFSLIKYNNSNKVFLLEGRKKRWIADESTFRKHRFSFDRIVVIPVTEIYPDGEILK